MMNRAVRYFDAEGKVIPEPLPCPVCGCDSITIASKTFAECPSCRRKTRVEIEKIDVDSLRAKILVDHMFLESLLDRQQLKPDVEGAVRHHLEKTREHFSTCFAGSLEDAMEHLERALEREPGT